jgi:hypothetical protein
VRIESNLVVVKPRNPLIPSRISLASVLACEKDGGQDANAVCGQDTKPLLVFGSGHLTLSLSVIIRIEEADAPRGSMDLSLSKPRLQASNGGWEQPQLGYRRTTCRHPG